MKTLPRRVGVVVATHNRADHLHLSLRHILDQTHRPERIIVVDDGSTDHTAFIAKQYPVEYHYVELGGGVQCAPAKRFGFEKLIRGDDPLPYVCCIDDDDWIDPDYFEKLLDCMESDSRVAVACPKIRMFGEREGRIDSEYDPDILARTNIASSTSLIRSDVLRQVGGWPLVEDSVHEDWTIWRIIRDHGWQLKRADTTYHWRRHANSQTFRFRGRVDHGVHWCHTVDKRNLITIAVPFCGRHRVLSRFLEGLEQQTFPHGLVHLLFLDNSLDADFGRRLKQWLAGCDYGSFAYVPYHVAAAQGQTNDQTADGDRRANAAAVNDRCAGNWNRLAQLVQTDLVWCLEDDVIPPANCLQRLLQAFRPEVDAVSALYAGRDGNWIVKDFASLSPLRVSSKHCLGGVEPAGAVGMGCVLVRSQLLKRIPMRSDGEGDGHPWFDWNLWADAARLGAVIKVDGDLVCEHLIDGH